VRNKDKSINTFSLPLLLPRLNFILSFLILLPPATEWHGQMGNEGMRHGQMGNEACGQFITPCLCHSIFLTLFHYSSVGSVMKDTVPHELLQCGSSPCSLGTYCYSMGLPWAAAPARSLLLHGLSTICSVFQGISTCCGLGSSRGCRVDMCSSVVLQGLHGG